MNRPASTYVIIAHFTASGDFSQSKRGKKKREVEKQLVAIRAPLHQSPVNNGTSATRKWHFGIWLTTFQRSSFYSFLSFLPNTYLQSIHNLNQDVKGPLSNVKELLQAQSCTNWGLLMTQNTLIYVQDCRRNYSQKRQRIKWGTWETS